MAQVGHEGGVQLPPELWQRILLCLAGLERRQLKSLCCVCRLFAGICQGHLFEEVSIRANAGIDYKTSKYDPISPWMAANPQRWPAQEWRWDEWELNMRSIVTSELRLTLIGTHDILATLPRKLTISGYDNCRDLYLPDPFQPPLGKQMLSRAIFDALLRFRQTLPKQLPAFANLRRLELFKYPVENTLLAAIDAHPSLNELHFDFCWFPESTSPLISTTALSFGFIPGSHALYTFHPMGDSDPELPDNRIPDHHLASAFDLISPSHIERLNISLGTQDSRIEPVLKQFHARTAGRGEFASLKSLVFHFVDEEAVSMPSSLIFQFFERTPALRNLTVSGHAPSLSPIPTFPTTKIPALEVLACPLDWGMALIPGRPLKELRLHQPGRSRGAGHLARTEAELNDLCRPLTLSTSPITTLHLPSATVLGPVWISIPYLTARFPFLRHLAVAVAGEIVGRRSPMRRCGYIFRPASPFESTDEQIVEDGLLELLEGGIRANVETALTEGQRNPLPPVLDRILAFRGVASEQRKQAKSPLPLPSIIPYNANSPTAPPAAEGCSDSIAALGAYFADRDPHTGIPVLPPETALDLVYFLSRGYYPLPSAIETLTIYSNFEKASLARRTRTGGRFQRSTTHHEDKRAEELCTKALLGEVSQRYDSLSTFQHEDLIERGRNWAYYRRSVGYSEGNIVWV